MELLINIIDLLTALISLITLVLQLGDKRGK